MQTEQRPRISSGLLLFALTLLVSGCIANSPPLLPIPPELPKPAQVPRMPESAKQPLRPPECLPTCTENASAQTERATSLLTRLQTPDRPASAGQ